MPTRRLAVREGLGRRKKICCNLFLTVCLTQEVESTLAFRNFLQFIYKHHARILIINSVIQIMIIKRVLPLLAVLCAGLGLPTDPVPEEEAKYKGYKVLAVTPSTAAELTWLVGFKVNTTLN